MNSTRWVALLAAMTLATAPVVAQATTSSEAAASDATYAPASDAAYDAAPKPLPYDRPDGAGDAPATDAKPVPPRIVDRCIDHVGDGLDNAHRYVKHIKHAMRQIEHKVTALEIKEMRVRNTLENIEVGAPIDENQTAHLEKTIARAKAALEGDVSERREAYLLAVIARAEAALEAGVWTEEDVASLEKQLERIQTLQDRLLKRYIHLKLKLDDLRERYDGWASNGYGCLGKIVDGQHPTPVQPDSVASVASNVARPLQG